jgi:hypothetical protein
MELKAIAHFPRPSPLLQKSFTNLIHIRGPGISLAVSSSWRLRFMTRVCRMGVRLSHKGLLVKKPPRWSGFPAPPRCFCPCSAPLPACHRSRRHGGILDHGLQVSVKCRGAQEDGRFPRGLFHGISNAAHRIPGPLGEHRAQDRTVLFL